MVPLMRFLLLFIAAILPSVTLAGKPIEICGDFSSIRVPARFCIIKTLDSLNKDVVYFYNGIMGDERDWVNREDVKKVFSIWERDGVDAPTFIGISFDRVWLAVPYEKRGLYSLLANKIIPFVENQLFEGKIQRRLLFGASMGGHNGMQLYLRNPTFYNRTLLACPALASISPWDPFDEFRKFQSRTGANWFAVGVASATARHFYGTPELWDAQSPLEYLRHSFFPKEANPVHIAIGERDEFGFAEGGRIAAKLLGERGVESSLSSRPGGHCDIDPEHIARELILPR